MYASTIIMVGKKDAAGNYTAFRQCGDYRPLNLETTFDGYHLLGILDRMGAVVGVVGGAVRA